MIAVPLLAIYQGDLSLRLHRLHALALDFAAQMIPHDKQERRTFVLVVVVPLRARVEIHLKRRPNQILAGRADLPNGLRPYSLAV